MKYNNAVRFLYSIFTLHVSMYTVICHSLCNNDAMICVSLLPTPQSPHCYCFKFTRRMFARNSPVKINFVWHAAVRTEDRLAPIVLCLVVAKTDECVCVWVGFVLRRNGSMSVFLL